MPNITNADLMQALLNKISGIVTGVAKDGDKPEVAPAQPNLNYLAWCSPGLPFQAKDLKFISKGLNGKDAEETKMLGRTASQFAQLVNMIPKDNLMNRFEGAGSKLWDVYWQVLTQSKVSDKPISDADQKKLDKFRGLMTVEEVDLMDDTKKNLKPGPIIKAYNKYMKEYEDKCMEYNDKRIAALSGDNKAVLDFQSNGQIYLKRIKTAMSEWVADGYKNDVENMRNFIAQIAEKSNTAVKENLKAQMTPEIFKKTDDMGGFYYTAVLPASFADDDAGWTKFTFTSSDVDKYSKNHTTSTSGGIKAFFGLWNTGAGTKVNSVDSESNEVSNDFSMSFSITQTPISRPWFSPEFLLSKGWKFEDEKRKLSDGKAQGADGDLTAYPVNAIWIKDVKITSKALAEHVERHMLNHETDARVGWGPFSFGAKHSNHKDENSQVTKRNGNTLEIPGWQIIAFNCFKMPKSPDPVVSSDMEWV